PCTTIEKLANNYLCGRSKIILSDNSYDKLIYQAAHITDINPKSNNHISPKNTKGLIDFLTVHKGQVLMTRSGTIGKIVYVSKTLDNKIFTPDLLRIEVYNEIDAGYIYAYLKSKIGQMLISLNFYGAVVQHLEPEHLAGVPIPDAPTEL
ncbi:MAG: hypothetical protein IJ563_08960, partial [Selenomonadaceae bacterium]|nr:hypothetical protein [Selenomonadaceae bacterium]